VNSAAPGNHGGAPFLAIERVVKRFAAAGPAVVDGVSLTVGRGEFFALLGPSGCGKTTLLRMLAGFADPDEGRIFIDGADMAGVPPYARAVNMMFQSYALFPHMSVAANVGFGLRQEKLARVEIDRRVAAMLELVRLGRLAERKPAQLSGGEKQRVALARALVKEPKLLLLDEPLAALDRKLREETRFELVRIQQRVGIAFLMVTHDQDEAMSMAGRIAVMRDGHIAQLGSPREIYEHPCSRFVADFIGGVNLLSGRVEASADGILSVACAETGSLLRVAGAGAVGADITLAVRPERIILARQADASLPNLLSGTVRAAAFRGEASSCEVTLASGAVLRASFANDVAGLRGLAVGDAVWAGFAPDAAVSVEP
jgi:putrescine transport system ATP-binding protein